MSFTVLTPRQIKVVSKNIDKIGGALANIVTALGGLPVDAKPRKPKARKPRSSKAPAKTTKAKAASSPAGNGADLTA